MNNSNLSEGTRVHVPVMDVRLEGCLNIPQQARDIVVFAHGTGSNRLSRRNNYIARQLQIAGHGTLLIDLLLPEENEHVNNQFQIELLSMRLVSVSVWLLEHRETKGMNIGYFSVSTGTAAAFKAAAYLGKNIIKAIVSRGGRPDMAQQVLHKISVPTLLIAGGMDIKVIEHNQQAFRSLAGEKRLDIIAGAGHQFREPGKLEKVAMLTSEWFDHHLVTEESLNLQ